MSEPLVGRAAPFLPATKAGPYEEHVAHLAGSLPFWGGLVFFALAPLDALARAPAGRVVLAFDIAAGIVTIALGLAWHTGMIPHRHANGFVTALGIVGIASIAGSSFFVDRMGHDFPNTEAMLGVVLVAISALVLSWRSFGIIALSALASAFLVLRDVNQTTLQLVGFLLAMLCASVIIHHARFRSIGATLEAKAALDAAQRSARIGSFEQDLARGKVECSPMMRQLFEIAPWAPIKAEDMAARVVPEQRERLVGAFTRLATEGTPLDERVAVILPSGAQGTYWFRGERREGWRGLPSRMAVTVQDVTAEAEAARATEEARAERALHERLAAVATLAAGAAHEFNNPLTYAVGSLDTARAELGKVLAAADMPAPTRSALELADRDLQATAKGLDRIAAITRALHRATSASRAEPTEEDPAALVQAALARTRSLFSPRTSIALRLDAVAKVRTPAEDTKAILTALLVNTADALREARGGEGAITVGTREEGAFVVFEVSDNGPGVDPADRARLFTPFFTTKNTPERTGLSLSIAHQAARDQGGDLTYAPTPGGGATFRLRVPRA